MLRNFKRSCIILFRDTCKKYREYRICLYNQVRRDKNPRQGESLDKDKDKTDSTTTNKQDPQGTLAGRPADYIYMSCMNIDIIYICV